MYSEIDKAVIVATAKKSGVAKAASEFGCSPRIIYVWLEKEHGQGYAVGRTKLSVDTKNGGTKSITLSHHIKQSTDGVYRIRTSVDRSLKDQVLYDFKSAKSRGSMAFGGDELYPHLVYLMNVEMYQAVHDILYSEVPKPTNKKSKELRRKTLMRLNALIKQSQK